MAVFDKHIRKIAGYLEGLRIRGEKLHEFACPPLVSDLVKGLPVWVGAGANPGIILRSDTFVELGNPEVGSTSLLLWTDDPSLLRDGKITLIGPDIQESPGASLPFAQIILVGGKNLSREMHQRIEGIQHVSDQIEGYMVRSSARNIWGRVSKEAASKEFCFEVLGCALMGLMRSSVSEVEAMEIVFVTSSKEDIRKIDEIAAEVQIIGSELVKEVWKAKGYDIECDYNCSSCTHKPVCDDIREINTARKEKGREAGAQ